MVLFVLQYKVALLNGLLMKTSTHWKLKEFLERNIFFIAKKVEKKSYLKFITYDSNLPHSFSDVIDQV